MEEIEQLQCRIRKLEGVAESTDAAVEDPGPPCHE